MYPRERTPVPNALEAGWTPDPVWTFLEKIKSLTPVRIRNPNHPASADEFGTHFTGGWIDTRAGLDVFREDKITYTCPDSNPEPSSQCRRIRFRTILSFFFRALNPNLASHEFKDDRRVKHDCDKVDVTQETVWHHQGTGKFVPRYDKCLSFDGDRVQSSGIAGQLNMNCFY